MLHSREEKLAAVSRLLDVMERLRKDCPWDREQTTESLRTNTLEEVYELSDAILSGQPDEVKKELGDVLLHIVFYSTIGEEQGRFDLCDVANALCDKLIYRHPHVYGEAVAESAGAVVKRWEELKQHEKDGNKTVLSGVPASLPTLIKAYRIQDKARGVGFDWEQPEDVWMKVDEELGELREAIASKSADDAEGELGDFLFSVINVARKYDLNPDNALERTNAKFIRRFGYIEAKAKETGRSLRDMTLAEMDELWNEAKRLESQS